MGDGECAVSPGSLGVHTALGDHFPVEMGEFLQVPDILQQNWTTRSGGHGVLVVDNRGAVSVGEFLLLAHESSPYFSK
jgi:hypothetical protein